jgi:hypothetical protein
VTATGARNAASRSCPKEFLASTAVMVFIGDPSSDLC